ncbi:hypothetical protein B0J12DRAFT_26816 [Macrophomina phaseolina]|uniref:Secreted protein n=1 Tax=Macrophomina phaseolina TaxID=35725 RepID=A0ABQ8GV79_9PEZI|nr:hypothetical protein B0J12DRAFT_26816 [Macrophomina phaseolina]
MPPRAGLIASGSLVQSKGVSSHAARTSDSRPFVLLLVLCGVVDCSAAPLPHPVPARRNRCAHARIFCLPPTFWPTPPERRLDAPYSATSHSLSKSRPADACPARSACPILRIAPSNMPPSSFDGSFLCLSPQSKAKNRKEKKRSSSLPRSGMRVGWPDATALKERAVGGTEGRK